jgi:hypothetical protein
MLTEVEVEAIKPVRYARKVWDGRGLYLSGDTQRRTVLAILLPLCEKVQEAVFGNLPSDYSRVGQVTARVRPRPTQPWG